jgi:hypothetical protein
MRTRFLALGLVSIWALTASARSEPLTFEQGYAKGWAEENGPQFAMALSEDEVAVVRRALDHMEEEHLANPDGIDNYQMGRRTRFLAELDHVGFAMWGMYLDIAPVDATGRSWRIQHMSLPEITMVGRSVSRDRYCRAENEDVDDWHFLDAVTICDLHNQAAISLYDRIESARHETPGGATRSQ